MENQNEEPTLLFQKFLEGSCNAQELQLLLDHFHMDEIDPQLKDLVERKLQSDEKADQVMLARVNQIINTTDKAIAKIAITNPSHSAPKIIKLNLLNWKWLTTVAAIVFIVAIGVLKPDQVWLFKEQLAQTEVPNKTIKTIVLADGSRITLNAGSKFRYPKKFSGDTREVFLEGEAMFEVKRDVTKPFIVHSGNLRTTVLGTSFNIKAYKGDERIQVTVITGKVNVIDTGTGRNVNLIPDEQVVYNTKTDGFDLQKTRNTLNATIWKAGRLAFDDVRFDEVAEQFTRKYGKQVVLENPAIGNCRISMVFNQEQPDEILRIIGILANASYKNEGDKITFSGSGCPEENSQNNSTKN